MPFKRHLCSFACWQKLLAARNSISIFQSHSQPASQPASVTLKRDFDSSCWGLWQRQQQLQHHQQQQQCPTATSNMQQQHQQQQQQQQQSNIDAVRAPNTRKSHRHRCCVTFVKQNMCHPPARSLKTGMGTPIGYGWDISRRHIFPRVSRVYCILPARLHNNGKSFPGSTAESIAITSTWILESSEV